jgi:hypothetical protein
MFLAFALDQILTEPGSRDVPCLWLLRTNVELY